MNVAGNQLACSFLLQASLKKNLPTVIQNHGVGPHVKLFPITPENMPLSYQSEECDGNMNIK